MQAFVNTEPGTQLPDEWSINSTESYAISEEMMQTDPLPMVSPYDSTSSTGPVDPTVATAAKGPRYAIYCSAIQDRPHRSSTINRRVNTHMRGKCPVPPVFHSLAGATYRQMWYGWLMQVAVADVSSSAHMGINLAFRCHSGSYERYRSFGRFHAQFTNGYKGVTYRDTYGYAECR